MHDDGTSAGDGVRARVRAHDAGKGVRMSDGGPLAGITVVEIGRFITAPYAAMLLGDLGATVVKVESVAGGDPFRQAGEPGISARFLAYNRNKRSIGLDLATAAGSAVLDRLLGDADVLIENFRPGVMAGFGLDYDRVAERHPGLVYCSITGAGPDGPAASSPMYDAIGQGLSGLMAQLSEVDSPQPVGPALSDGITGMTAALAIQAALVERSRTGRGRYVQTSMIEATVSFLAEPAAHYFRTGEEQDRLTRPRQSQSFGFLAGDGRPFVIHLSSPPKFWHRLLAVAGRPELDDDPRFSTYALRVRNYGELRRELSASFARADRAHWLKRFAEEDVPAAPVLTTRETFEHEQVRHLGLEVVLDGPDGLRVAGPGARLASTVRMSQPPAFGADTDAVLESLGYSAAEIADLRAGAVVR